MIYQRWPTRHDIEIDDDVSTRVREDTITITKDLHPKASVQIDKYFGKSSALLSTIHKAWHQTNDVCKANFPIDKDFRLHNSQGMTLKPWELHPKANVHIGKPCEHG